MYIIETENIREKLDLIKNHPWKPLDIAMVNNHKIRLGFCKGDYGWHVHDDADEFFYVLKGKLKIELKGKNLILKEGNTVCLPKGVPHNLMGDPTAFIMVVEPIHLQTRRVDKDKIWPSGGWQLFYNRLNLK